MKVERFFLNKSYKQTFGKFIYEQAHDFEHGS